jgi:hypothetical protein
MGSQSGGPYEFGKKPTSTSFHPLSTGEDAPAFKRFSMEFARGFWVTATRNISYL